MSGVPYQSHTEQPYSQYIEQNPQQEQVAIQQQQQQLQQQLLILQQQLQQQQQQQQQFLPTQNFMSFLPPQDYMQQLQQYSQQLQSYALPPQIQEFQQQPMQFQQYTQYPQYADQLFTQQLQNQQLQNQQLENQQLQNQQLQNQQLQNQYQQLLNQQNQSQALQFAQQGHLQPLQMVQQYIQPNQQQQLSYTNTMNNSNAQCVYVIQQPQQQQQAYQLITVQGPHGPQQQLVAIQQEQPQMVAIQPTQNTQAIYYNNMNPYQVQTDPNYPSPSNFITVGGNGNNSSFITVNSDNFSTNNSFNCPNSLYSINTNNIPPSYDPNSLYPTTNNYVTDNVDVDDKGEEGVDDDDVDDINTNIATLQTNNTTMPSSLRLWRGVIPDALIHQAFPHHCTRRNTPSSFPLYCLVCEEIFTSRLGTHTHLLEHMLYNSPTCKVKCNLCKLGFSSTIALRQHSKSIQHIDLARMACDDNDELAMSEKRAKDQVSKLMKRHNFSIVYGTSEILSAGEAGVADADATTANNPSDYNHFLRDAVIDNTSRGLSVPYNTGHSVSAYNNRVGLTVPIDKKTITIHAIPGDNFKVSCRQYMMLVDNLNEEGAKINRDNDESGDENENGDGDDNNANANGQREDDSVEKKHSTLLKYLKQSMLKNHKMANPNTSTTNPGDDEDNNESNNKFVEEINNTNEPSNEADVTEPTATNSISSKGVSGYRSKSNQIINIDLDVAPAIINKPGLSSTNINLDTIQSVVINPKKLKSGSQSINKYIHYPRQINASQSSSLNFLKQINAGNINSLAYLRQVHANSVVTSVAHYHKQINAFNNATSLSGFKKGNLRNIKLINMSKSSSSDISYSSNKLNDNLSSNLNEDSDVSNNLNEDSDSSINNSNEKSNSSMDSSSDSFSNSNNFNDSSNPNNNSTATIDENSSNNSTSSLYITNSIISIPPTPSGINNSAITTPPISPTSSHINNSIPSTPITNHSTLMPNDEHNLTNDNININNSTSIIDTDSSLSSINTYHPTISTIKLNNPNIQLSPRDRAKRSYHQLQLEGYTSSILGGGNVPDRVNYGNELANNVNSISHNMRQYAFEDDGTDDESSDLFEDDTSNTNSPTNKNKRTKFNDDGFDEEGGYFQDEMAGNDNDNDNYNNSNSDEDQMKVVPFIHPWQGVVTSRDMRVAFSSIKSLKTHLLSQLRYCRICDSVTNGIPTENGEIARAKHMQSHQLYFEYELKGIMNPALACFTCKMYPVTQPHLKSHTHMGGKVDPDEFRRIEVKKKIRDIYEARFGPADITPLLRDDNDDIGTEAMNQPVTTKSAIESIRSTTSGLRFWGNIIPKSLILEAFPQYLEAQLGHIRFYCQICEEILPYTQSLHLAYHAHYTSQSCKLKCDQCKLGFPTSRSHNVHMGSLYHKNIGAMIDGKATEGQMKAKAQIAEIMTGIFGPVIVHQDGSKHHDFSTFGDGRAEHHRHL